MERHSWVLLSDLLIMNKRVKYTIVIFFICVYNRRLMESSVMIRFSRNKYTLKEFDTSFL